MQGFGDHPVVWLVELQVERGRLDGLLLVTGQPREAVGEGVSCHVGTGGSMDHFELITSFEFAGAEESMFPQNSTT